MDDIMNTLFDTEPSLPPAGQARREELARRTDTLVEAAETQTPDSGRIPQDHDALRPERNREIQNHLAKSHLEIGTAHPYYMVKWVNYVNQQGSMIWTEKAKGWKVATVDEFPEARELSREDRTIRIGDVLLMFIRKDEHYLLEQKEHEKRLRQQYGVEAEIHDLAARNRRIFPDVHTPSINGVPDNLMNEMERRSSRRQGIRKIAAQHLGNQMKKGTISGVPIK